MDKTKKLFDEWAVTGRAEEMEKVGMGGLLEKLYNYLTVKRQLE